jgi:hypothetical protein
METFKRQIERAAQYGQSRQHHQRNGHNLWAFLRMCGGFMPCLTEEDHPNLTPHIEGCQEGSNGQKPVNSWIMQAGIQKDLILRPEPCKRKNTCERQSPDHIEPERDRHGLAEAAHVAHVAGIEHFVFVRGIMSPVTMRGVMMPAFEAENDRTR